MKRRTKITKLPPELETLVWTIAEQNDPVVIEEFLTRYPSYRAELIKRVNAVQALRASGQATAGVIPDFARPTSAGFPRLGRFAIIGALAASLAFGGYRLSQQASPVVPHNSAIPELIPSQIHKDPSPLLEVPGRTPSVSRPIESDLVPEGHLAPVPPKDRLPSASSRPVSLHIQRALLHTVLEGLAIQSKWRLTIAPGTPNPEIRIDYDLIAPVDILQDMGRRFGFTALDEGKGGILIVPALDGAGPTDVAPDGDLQTSPEQTHSPKKSPTGN